MFGRASIACNRQILSCSSFGDQSLSYGNPLLALRVPATGRGIRLILNAPRAEGNDLGAWFDTFAAGEPTETAELVLDVKTTPTTLAVAAILVEHWLADRLTAEELARWLEPWAEEE